MNELESLKTIFTNKIFKIPDYQRGYAWTKKELKDFWEDIVNLPTDKSHYTGLLSIKKVDKIVWEQWNNEKWLLQSKGYKAFHVVDGQQRLTTFVLFIQAISDLLKNIPENKDKKNEEIYLGVFHLKEIKEEYLVISQPPQYIINTYKFGYETDNPSFTFLKHRIFNEPNAGTIQETFYTLNLENAKNFFAENLAEYLKEYGISEIEALFKKVTQNLMFNVYEINDDVDVFVAFETMNNRGKKLSNLELLKNRLIYISTLYDENELTKNEQIALREKINDAWKEIYYQLGRNKQHPLNDDDFLIAHWIMYFQYTREKGDDYIKFLLDKTFTPQNIYRKRNVKTEGIQEINETRDEETDDEESVENYEDNSNVVFQNDAILQPKEIEDYVNSLKSAAVHWFNTHNPIGNNQLTEKECLWIDRLNRIGIAYFRPLITASFLSERIDSASRVLLFQAVERFIFITFRLGRAFSSYRNSEFYKAARQLKNNQLTVADVINNLEQRMDYCFSTKEDNGDIFFDYSFFQKFIEKKFRNGGGFYDWNGLRYFLYEYEMEKVRGRGNQKIDWKLFVKSEKDKISIEHIYPQTANNEYWKANFKGCKKSELNFLQGTLGNLLPLSQSINSSLQNDSFPDKKSPKNNRHGYSDGSHSEIEVSQYDEWNPQNILERGLKLIDFMERRWNLKFENNNAKIKLLFLNFLSEEREVS